MLKQLFLVLGLIAAAQASFIYVLSENVIRFKGIAVYIQTRGFLAYEGGATEWSAGIETHPGAAKTLTIKFSDVVVNIGGIDTDHNTRMGITVKGNYWGEYYVTQIKDTGVKTYYAVCHNDSNTNYCGDANWQYMTQFAIDHI